MLNKVVFQGRLTHTPMLTQRKDGKCYLKNAVAVERNYRNADGERETDFFNFIAWGKTAEYIAAYFVKGQMILLTGSMQVRTYETNDGEKRTVYEISAEDAFFAGPKPEPHAEKAESEADSNEEIGPDQHGG